jgi:hypothetical protein
MPKKESFTFEEDDCFELKAFSERLESFIAVEHHFVEGGLVLALNADFGSGKTTFIEMWKNDLLRRRDKGEFVPMPVVLNAWESDHCGDPLVAVLAGLVEAVDSWKGEDAPDKSSFKEAMSDLGWFATGLANEYLAKTIGLNPVKAAEFVEKKKGGRAPKIPDFIQLYQHRIDALRKLKTELEGAFGGKESKVIVFVDELDRCRPDYAISFLETIKHVFDIEGMVFVLAVDYFHLGVSAKALYGSDLRFDEYFRKFCHRTVALPPPTESQRLQLVSKYVGKYVEVAGRRMSRINCKDGLNERMTELATAFKMPPRQLQEAFRILGHTMYALDESRRGNIRWGIAVGAMVLSCLRVADPKMFMRVRQSDEGVIDLCKLIASLLEREEAFWWMAVILSGCIHRNLGRNQPDFRKDFLFKAGHVSSDDQFNAFFHGMSGAWTGATNEFRKIGEAIDHVKTL